MTYFLRCDGPGPHEPPSGILGISSKETHGHLCSLCAQPEGPIPPPPPTFLIRLRQLVKRTKERRNK